jgi:hypothetical protein
MRSAAICAESDDLISAEVYEVYRVEVETAVTTNMNSYPACAPIREAESGRSKMQVPRLGRRGDLARDDKNRNGECISENCPIAR